MPTLDIENLTALQRQALAPRSPQFPSAQTQTTTPLPSTAAACYNPSYNLAVEQGATSSTQIVIQITDANGVLQPVNITGYQFQFTAKTDPTLPDTDPTVVKVDWQETNTPTLGATWLTLSASLTSSMQLTIYYYQVRMISPSGIVTPVVNGTLTVCPAPVSARY